jgi:phage minor structural protein
VLTGTVGQILNSILSETGWTAGLCSGFGIVEIEVWHKSVRECIAQLCEEVHGELYTMIDVGENGVTARRLGIVRERGSSTVTRQFRYGRNVTGVKREVGSEEVYTACIGYGAKVNSEDESQYADRLNTIVYSDANLDLWGIQMSNGKMAQNFMTYTDEQCTDASFLKRQCERQLDVFSKPLVRYEFEAIETDGMWSDVRLGNRVSCVDDDFEPPIEMIERVSHIRRDLRGRDTCIIAIGKRVNPITEKFKAQEKVERRTTGNSSRSNADRPVRTEGGSTYSGGGGGGVSSDRWIHQIDGVTQETGTINFVTTGGGSGGGSTGDEPTSSGMGGKHNISLWDLANSRDTDPAGGGGGFSGGGGNGWGTGGGGGAF